MHSSDQASCLASGMSVFQLQNRDEPISPFLQALGKDEISDVQERLYWPSERFQKCLV